MYNATSSLASLATAYTGSSQILLYAIGAILAIAVALLGVGYGFRQVKSKVTGQSFGNVSPGKNSSGKKMMVYGRRGQYRGASPEDKREMI